jgi:hypothetical protein
MKLWVISQDANSGYDTFSDAVIAANTELEARHIHPGGDYRYEGDSWWATRPDGSKWQPCNTWASPDEVKAECIGTAKKGLKYSVICSSFHAG